MESGGDSALRYLEASRLQTAAGELANVSVRNGANRTIGHLDGVLIDPAERRLRFFVVQTPGWFKSRRYLVPTDWPAHLGRNGTALHVDAAPEELARCQKFDQSAVAAYSDDDLLTMLFRVA